MEVKAKVYGGMTYTADGEENGQEFLGYKEVEVPEYIMKDVLVIFFADDYYVHLKPARNILDEFDLWDKWEEYCLEYYEKEMEEYIVDNYDYDELGGEK